MAKLGINTGSTPNDGTGDTLLAAALKINQNFTEIYTILGDGSNLSGVVTSLVGYATEGYVDSAIVGFVTSGALSGYATEGYVDSAIQSSYWTLVETGITTSSNVGIGTTNPTEKLTVRGGDISVGIDTSYGLILTSPNGTPYRLIVDNFGNLSTTAVW